MRAAATDLTLAATATLDGDNELAVVIRRVIPLQGFVDEIPYYLSPSLDRYHEAEVPGGVEYSFESSGEDLQAGNDDAQGRLDKEARKRHIAVKVARFPGASTLSLSRGISMLT